MSETKNDPEVISTLLFQHHQLRRELASTREENNKPVTDFTAVVNFLNEFKKTLIGHLALEDNVFYPQILKKLKEKGSNTEKTEEFIAAMKGLADTTMAFLDKYQEPSSVENNFEQFKTDFEDMAGAILIRVTSEEDGVYLYWDL